MNKYRRQLKLFIFSAGLIFLVWPYSDAHAASISARLSGQILLQVQSQGEAWYVSPVNLNRYYLGRPADAFSVMRSLGLGITEQDYRLFSGAGASRLKGRILLRVQASGEAYYVTPSDGRLHYLGRPADAFAIMRQFGLGISNQDLNQISVASGTSVNPVVQNNPLLKNFTWKYDNQSFSLSTDLSNTLYQAYSTSPKVYTYYTGQEPEDIREAFYGLFLKIKTEDGQTNGVLSLLRRRAADLNLSADESVAYVMSFIQYIPYDHVKVEAGNNNPYYPFETLYLQKGVCADKTFLAVLWLRTLGYGAAILDFPDSNHSAAGIACPVADSLAGSGYCYIETTNYFPLGVVPPSITGGQAAGSEESFDNLFNASHLGRMDIKQKTQGKVYQGVDAVKNEVSAIVAARAQLNTTKSTLQVLQSAVDSSYQALKQQESELLTYKNSGQISTYNSLVPVYNAAVAAYQVQATEYQAAVTNYNQLVQDFNLRYRLFYQQ